MSKKGSRALIIISCSDRKRTAPRAPVAAINRYDGVFYRLLRKAQREGRVSASVTLIILSAKYGLIRPTTRIRHYEQRISPVLASTLRPTVRRKLRGILRRGCYERIYVNLGRDYAPLVNGLTEIDNAIWAIGGIGTRAQMLKRWLSAESRAAHGSGSRA